MLDFLRKHQGTMWIVITVVVIISFVFFTGTTQPKTPGQIGPEDTAFTIYGKSHSIAELGRLQRLHSLANMLQLRVEGTQASFSDTLSFIAQSYQFQENIQPDFAFNLLVLRHELEKNGIHIGDNEARDAFRGLSVLKDSKTGEFNGAQAEFFQNQLGSMGFRLPDLYDLMRDWVGLQKLIELVSGNLVAQQHLTDVFYAARFQNIKAVSLPFARETYKKEAKVTDEEIAKYFEERKDDYKTEEKRALSYVFFANPDTEKLSAEERTKAVNSHAEKVNNFALAVIAPNADFDAEAKKAGIEIKTVPAFSRNQAPEELKSEFQLLAGVFNNVPASRPISDPVEGSKGYYIFKVTDVQAPKPQTLDDVKETIRETLLTQKGNEAMTKAVNDTRKKLEEAIKGGKSFADAAKEAGLNPQNLPDFSPTNPPTGLSNGPAIAEAASTTAAGAFAEPVSAENGLLLVYVLEKNLYKRDDTAAVKTGLNDSLSRSLQFSVFRAWFERRRDEARLNADPLIQRSLSVQGS